MTTKPKRKAPAGINPKLIALAAKIDQGKSSSRNLSDDELNAADTELCKLERKLAKVAATNLEELKLKVRYVSPDGVMPDIAIAQSIINDLLAMEPRAAKER